RQAVRATLGVKKFAFSPPSGQFTGNDPRRYGDNGVTQNHDKTRNELPRHAHGGDVAVSYGGERDDGPIDTFGNAGKATFAIFHQVHDCTQYHANDEDSKEKNKDFGAAGSQSVHQFLRFTHVLM